MLLGALWTIPVGVAIGFNPRLARIAQPLAQIAASVPATALFPVVLLVLIRLGGGLGVGSIVLLLLGTQWYILFNVIAGAIAIPTDLKEAASVFGIAVGSAGANLSCREFFRFLVTGMITASGGAWNASIVAEYFHFKGQTYSTVGVGAMISAATDAKNFNLLLASTIALAAVVVTTNRLCGGGSIVSPKHDSSSKASLLCRGAAGIPALLGPEHAPIRVLKLSILRAATAAA